MDNLVAVIVASLLSGLVGVGVTLWVQRRAAKKAEQMLIFKTLMSTRFIYGASYEKTRALNLLDVVFYNVKSVVGAWEKLYKSYAEDNPSTSEIEDNTILLLEAMAKHLNYKDLNWDTIKKSYLPIGISNDMQNQAEYEKLQLDLMRGLSGSGILQMFTQGNPYTFPIGQSSESEQKLDHSKSQSVGSQK